MEGGQAHLSSLRVKYGWEDFGTRKNALYTLINL